jgi:predicted lipoprotein with Yx(FWY)xxD motif
MRNRWWAAPGAAAAIVFLAACGSSAASGSGSASPSSGGAASSSPANAGGSSTSSAAGIMTTSAKGGTVLTTASGFAIYWFAPDSAKKSVCNGTCAQFWPPLTGKPTVGSGANLTGKWGTITRADGSTQATYDGHPLYTFKGDKSPGQVTGNGVNESGGLWWSMTPSGAKLAKAANGGGAAPSPSSTSGGGGGGYGY